ncbi:hypothetical protein NKH77_51545 [Streptomyces sp. M19]
MRENLQSASDADDPHAYVTGLVHSGNGENERSVAAAAQLTGVTEYLGTQVESLSLGWHARVTMARARRPARGAAAGRTGRGPEPEARGRVAEVIRTAAAELGIAVLLVEHNIDVVLDTCDEVVVLDRGRVIAVGAPDEVLRLPHVRTAYLGEPLDPDTTAEAAESAQVGGVGEPNARDAWR